MGQCRFCSGKTITAFKAEYVLPVSARKAAGMYIINNRGIDRIQYHNGVRKIETTPVRFCPFCGRDLTKSAS